MTDIACSELIAEVEAAAKAGAPAQRARMLQELTDLFRASAARLKPAQIAFFDAILLRLIERNDVRTLIRTSTALAGLEPAPVETVRHLALHKHDAVAVPLLTHAASLPDDDLVQIICDRGQRHLVAIASRPQLSEDITSLLLKRAGKETARVLVKNLGARFTPKAYAALVTIAERDDVVAEAAGLRPDLPAPLLAELLAKTSDTVRTRLLKAAPVPLREKIKAIIETVADAAPRPLRAADDHSDALLMVEGLNRVGKLNDSTVNRFAIRRELPNVVASLATLSGAAIASIAPMMDDTRCEGMLIACRAARLNWQTTISVLSNRNVPKPSKEQLDMAREMFEMLNLSAAQYTMRHEPPTPVTGQLAREASR